ncbi:hypothetical protein J2W92_004674 [Rhizobium leguminosarum]
MSMAVNMQTAKVLGLRKPIARILTSVDGGPVRRIVDGRKTIYTGFFTSVKADFGQMPWESRKSEKTTMILAEASSRVVSLLAQPHRLEIFVNEQKTPLKYFPDLQLKVHPSLLFDLQQGTPFSVAALAPSNDEPDDRLRTVVFEIKDDRDHRQRTSQYKAKLELAADVYRRMGITFFTIQRGEEIFPYQLRIASNIVSWRHTSVNQRDVWTVQSVLRSSTQAAGEVALRLGGGALGWAKLRALHVRRIVEIDLTESVSPDSRVRLLKNNTLQVRVRS